MKHILCYGDSNTWGFQPGFGGRYPRPHRWTGVAEGLLGDGYVFLENGLNGRTTDFDDPDLPYRNGCKGFAYAMVSQKPIDLLVLMLGTNDLKFTAAEGSRDGLARILKQALHPEIHFPSGSSPVYTGRPRVLLLPLATTVGTFAGAALASITLAYSLSECLAVGSGFAYYSLSSIFITQYKGAELGTVALLANIMRELATLLFTPLMVRWISPLAAISCGGASTMDSTLPVITRFAGKQWVFVSIVHAMILDFSVPFWVTFFCTL